MLKDQVWKEKVHDLVRRQCTKSSGNVNREASRMFFKGGSLTQRRGGQVIVDITSLHGGI